jgi:hypothetical protein
MIDEVAERCAHSNESLPDMRDEADRIRQLIAAMELANRFQEARLAEELYMSVQRQLLSLARSCAVVE